MAAAVYRSWGGLAAAPASIERPGSASSFRLPAGRWLAYGNGRSYGDSCLTREGALLDMRGLSRILSFDAGSGILRAEAGVLLGDIVRHLRGSGWFPPVLPGTQFVTVGGAIANDIHGKNHHGMGTFGRHVTRLSLLRSDRGRLDLSPSDALFRATVGGMGLTGVIVEAEIQLMRASAQDIIQEAQPLGSLADFFRLAPEAEARFPYVVAWIDSLASGSRAGRGVLLCGRHAERDRAAPLAAKPALSVPFTAPFALVNRPGLLAFNALYRWRALARKGAMQASSGSFFFPLDAVGGWNRLYGPKGLRQHQSLLPLHAGESTVAAMLQAAREAGHGSLLTVLKLFGPLPSPGMLSFPRPGVTLTLDFAYRGAATDALLDRLDALALAAGGRVNPYKDARMSRDTFAASFPEQERFRAFMDPAATSEFARRVGLVGR